MKRAWSYILILMVVLAWMPIGAGAEPKGKLTVGVAAEPITFDPHLKRGRPMIQAHRHVFDTLLFRDYNAKVIPQLATSYRSISPTVWEFKIRKGVKFSNGEPVDAQAVKYSIERVSKLKKSQQFSLFKSVDHVEVVDRYTARIHTKEPDTFLITVLTSFGHIVPPKYYSSHDMNYLARNPVGSGPYKLVSWKKNQEIVYEARPEYWDPSRNRIKTGVFKFIPEPTTRVAALLGGTVEVIDHVPPQMIPLVESKPEFKAVSAPSPITCYIMMIMKDDAPWKKLKVRQALNYAVDKEGIVKGILGGYGRVANGTVMGSNSYGYNPDLKPYPYDPAKAKKLLAEAGYADGFSAEIGLPLGRYLNGKQAVEAIAGQMAKVGVKLSVRATEYGAWRRRSRSRWNAGVKPFWTYGCGNNLLLHSSWMFRASVASKSAHGGVRDKDVDRRIAEARAEIDEVKRLRKYREINKLIRDKGLVVFLYELGQIVAKKKRVTWQAPANGDFWLIDASLK